MLYGISLIVLGLLAAPSLVLSRRPNAKELFDKMASIQGWLGIIFAILGLFGIIRSLIHIKIFALFPGYWVTWFLTAAVEMVLGFMLGYNLISKYALKSESASEKGQRVLKRLLPLQGTLGIIAIILGIWQIIATLIWIIR